MDQFFLIGRGLAGWHAQGLSQGNEFSSSGGSLESYAAQAVDGTLVYDADQSDSHQFIDWVFSCPLVDVSLKDVAQHNGYVSPAIYCQRLKQQVAGVKFGKVFAGAVVWEDADA